MRVNFVRTLEELAAANKDIFLVTGDLGYHVLEHFQDTFPNQFLNVGVAEQNMIGVATGLALSGKIVFVYSIANFPSLRPLEQVRNDICYHHAGVKIVSIGAGFHYGGLGATHHATEDMAVMRAMPNMTVICPADGQETMLITRALVRSSGPCYLRLGKDPGVLYEKQQDWKIGKGVFVRKGKDVTFISTGSLLKEAQEAADMLQKDGIDSSVLHIHTVKPIDRDAIEDSARTTSRIITVEEHNIIGGLGSAVAEVLAETGLAAKLKRVGIPDTFSSFIGDQAFLRQKYGLSVEALVKEAKIFLAQ